MKKNQKGKIRRLIDLEEKDGKRKSIARLTKRYKYLKSKLGQYRDVSNQMKYLGFHIKKLGGKI